MEILVWLFVGLMGFVAWLVFVTYRIDARNRDERQHQRALFRELQQRHDRAFWQRAGADAARLLERAARVRQQPPPAARLDGD